MLKNCIFCKLISRKVDQAKYIFTENKIAVAVLDSSPKSYGHTLIIPKQHAERLRELKAKLDFFTFAFKVASLLEKRLKCDALVYKLNDGMWRVESGHIPHLHLHIIPRYKKKYKKSKKLPVDELGISR